MVVSRGRGPVSVVVMLLDVSMFVVTRVVAIVTSVYIPDWMRVRRYVGMRTELVLWSS